jgi:adenosylcobyric acid synthase
MNDLNFIRVKHLDDAIQKHLEEGGFLVGICGGYQMLGAEMIDEAGSDTGIANFRVQGLEIIPARTFFQHEKETVRTAAHLHEDTGLSCLDRLEGYEIHLGRTVLSREGCSFLQTVDGKSDGYYGENGRVIGTYLHHLFHNDAWRNQWLNMIRKSKGLPEKEVVQIKVFKDQRFDDLARQMKEHINWELLTDVINQWSSKS